jgi:hypothetical protein
MEKAFIISKDSKYHKDLDNYIELCNQQKDFINKYFGEKGIEANTYRISGNGSVNSPFEDWEKDEISLSIGATNNDSTKFGKALCKKNEHGLCSFNKKSEISKDFAKRCIEEKVVINLWEPRISNYFESISFRGCRYHRIIHQDIMYMKIDSNHLDDKEVPDGFTEIKLSEFYTKLEEYNESTKGDNDESKNNK